MAITNSFRNAIATMDIRGIRIMMKDSLLVDPTFAEFSEMETLTKNISGLYDSHDGRRFEEDKSAWNDDYMNKLMVQVVGNFSIERIKHLKNVVRHLHPVASHPQKSVPSYTHQESCGCSTQKIPRPNYRAQKMQDKHNDRILNNRGSKVVASVAIGGVVGGTAAAVVGSSFVIGATVGMVAVSVVVALTTNGR